MGWPPKVGELLPRADEAVGVREKLRSYSLDLGHVAGGPKARGFALILGITIDSIDYVEAEIHSGIRRAPIKAVRDTSPFGLACIVEFPIQGLASRANRIVNLRTAWLLAEPGAPPRLTSAYLKP
jgi:hypothetical protein